MEFFPHLFCITYGNRGFNDDGRFDFPVFGASLYQLQHRFHGGTVKIVFYRIIIGRNRNDNKVCFHISRGSVQSRSKVQASPALLCLRQIFFNIFVFNRRYKPVQHFHFFRNNIYRRHFIVLCQQYCQGQPNITGSRHSDYVTPAGYRQVFFLSMKTARIVFHNVSPFIYLNADAPLSLSHRQCSYFRKVFHPVCIIRLHGFHFSTIGMITSYLFLKKFNVDSMQPFRF